MQKRTMLTLAATLLLLAAAGGQARAMGQQRQTTYRFDFGGAEASAGWTRVTTATAYSAGRGYGFEPGADGSGSGDDAPRLFSVAVPEGNYAVTVTLGDARDTSDTTVKAESRRLMLEGVKTAKGEIVRRTFTVNVRTPRLPDGRQVALKEREKGVLHWDDKLTLEFNGPRPHVRAVEIAPAPDAVTVFLAGDSTVTDQPREPWNSWGQMLTRFFGPGVAVANHAESGESLKSFEGQRRTAKVLSTIKPGDYLLIQFGHNDMKEKGEGVGAFTTYAASLKRLVDAARERGAHPVLVTPMHRRRFDEAGKVQDSLGDYPEAVRRVAKAEKLPLIDLHAMSRLFYEALGPEKSALAFQDGTHHNAYGSYVLARCVAEGIRASVPGLAKHLAADLPPFDPARPPAPESFSVPASPQRSDVKPDGS